jgi:hypothetical protein
VDEEYRRIVAAINDPRVDPRIRLAIEVAAECRTGQVLRCTRRMLALPDAVPDNHLTAPTGSLGHIELIAPGAGKKHGEVVVFTPEQRRAVDDALGGYLASYGAAWRARTRTQMRSALDAEMAVQGGPATYAYQRRALRASAVPRRS